MVNNNTISITDQELIKQDPIPLYSPSNPIPIETIFLSNIDQTVTFPVETVFFYEAPPNMAYPSTSVIAGRLRKAVEEVLLIPYYFLAGRLNFNDETKRLELVCNNAGALFVSAKARFSLKDLGNLAQPNPTFHRFVHRPGLYKCLAETSVFTIQVTMFQCGGFALGFTTNHAILDGKSASQMFHNLASITRGQGLVTQHINNDRTCIRARSPPHIQFPHDEYVNLTKTPSLASSFTSLSRTSPSPLIFSDKYIHKLFTFTPQMLSLLKQKAKVKCSTFETILAHVWRARTKASVEKNHEDRESTVLFAVDVRDIISPPLKKNFVGNAVITAFASARSHDLIGRPLSFSVEMVRKGRERVTSEYIRSVIDWLEVYKGIPKTCDGTFYVSAWYKLPFDEVDVGFGCPKHAGPIVSGNDEFVLFLSGGFGGINVWIGLEKEKMERFLDCVFEI
ncbi:omega-hydroxypalmitate o-feruloyl transferase [Phtheirospermum japonicum]|uniref:Omega-hydroxypalmitate o-feruloyl transferase n=1 Tax=Phtheirospermum japonicum TaxID=374723 RepID=A0A830C7D4_9LAMI|nr:omega-hydroxypalmitate o-feruloyl transferase [Phtheirospermum japonicum]